MRKSQFLLLFEVGKLFDHQISRLTLTGGCFGRPSHLAGDLFLILGADVLEVFAVEEECDVQVRTAARKVFEFMQAAVVGFRQTGIFLNSDFFH